MITSLDTIDYTKKGFDNDKYIKIQRQNIAERMDRFNNGRLYLEIGGGKILHDPHASRVLPGYLPDNKKTILKKLSNMTEIIFCVNAKDIESNRQLSSNDETYNDASFRLIKSLEEAVGIKPHIAITLCNNEDKKQKVAVAEFQKQASDSGYQTVKKYFIEGYPNNTDKIVSQQGYGKDEYLELIKPLIVVTGAASNSGKLSTALSQLYQDHQRDIHSGYAKFELFPIWSLPVEHPVNLAYEAATADIGDYNMIDIYHQKAYGKNAVNYNRDVEAFSIIKTISDKIVSKDSAMRNYNSPTDMGINFSGKAITNDEIVSIAAIREIRRRANWYSEIVARGHGDKSWIEKCLSLEKRAKRYIRNQDYNLDIKI